jgi:hypothetical protein
MPAIALVAGLVAVTKINRRSPTGIKELFEFFSAIHQRAA